MSGTRLTVRSPSVLPSCDARIQCGRHRQHIKARYPILLAPSRCSAILVCQSMLTAGRAHSIASRRPLALGALGTSALVAGMLAAGGGVALAASLASSSSGISSSSSSSSNDPRVLTRSGMDKFRAGDVEGSLADFDAVIQAAPHMRPYMWQRGLSLFYLDRFQEAAQQFREDVAVNPNDTEESIWAFLCEAQLVGAEQARKQLLQVGRDSRPVLRAADECFRRGEHPDKIMAQVADDGGHDTFYGLLYVGLWHESHGNFQEAKKAITTAVQTPYARLSGDYMTSLARVHCQRRGWLAA